MSQLTVQQVFGDNAYQDADFLVCNKNDFFKLTKRETNKAESLLVAILLKAFNNYQGQLTDPNDNLVTDSSNAIVDYKHTAEFTHLRYWKRQYFKRDNQPYLVDTFILEVYKPYTNGT